MSKTLFDKQETVCCQACGGTGQVPKEADPVTSFESWWEAILKFSPKGSRTRDSAWKKKCRDKWPNILKSVSAKEKEPVSFLIAKIKRYCVSESGQGEYSRNPYRLLNEQYWTQNEEDWGDQKEINEKDESLAERIKRELEQED